MNRHPFPATVRLKHLRNPRIAVEAQRIAARYPGSAREVFSARNAEIENRIRALKLSPAQRVTLFTFARTSFILNPMATKLAAIGLIKPRPHSPEYMQLTALGMAYVRRAAALKVAKR